MHKRLDWFKWFHISIMYYPRCFIGFRNILNIYMCDKGYWEMRTNIYCMVCLFMYREIQYVIKWSWFSQVDLFKVPSYWFSFERLHIRSNLWADIRLFSKSGSVQIIRLWSRPHVTLLVERHKVVCLIILVLFTSYWSSLM